MTNEETISTGSLGPQGPHSKSQISAFSTLRTRPYPKGKEFAIIGKKKIKKKGEEKVNLASYLNSLKVVKK